MSTKIFDAYKMKNISMNEMFEFREAIKEAALPKFEEAFLSDMEWKTKTAIVRALLFNAEYIAAKGNKKKEEKRLKLTLDWMYALKKQCGYKGTREEFTLEEAANKYNGIFGSPVMIVPDMQKEECAKGTGSLYGSMSFHQLSSKRLLCMCFGLPIIRTVAELSKDKDFSEKYGIKDYEYWNNTDKPDEISDREWNRRGRDWDKALPGLGVPAESGIVVSNFIYPDNYLNFFTIVEDGRMEKAAERILGVSEKENSLKSPKELQSNSFENSDFKAFLWERMEKNIRAGAECGKRCIFGVCKDEKNPRESEIIPSRYMTETLEKIEKPENFMKTSLLHYMPDIFPPKA